MWNAKKERFLQKYDWLHNAQVSFSTGTSGNSEIPNFDHLALASGGWRYALAVAPGIVAHTLAFVGVFALQ